MDYTVVLSLEMTSRDDSIPSESEVLPGSRGDSIAAEDELPSRSRSDHSSIASVGEDKLLSEPSIENDASIDLQPKQYVKFTSLDGKYLRYNLDNLICKQHLDGTLIAKTFFSNNFAAENEMELNFTFEVVKLLEPLIRANHLQIPPKRLFAPFRAMIDFLAGNNEIWISYSKLIDVEIADIFGRSYDLTDPLFEGKYFTPDNYLLYTADSVSNSGQVPDNVNIVIVNGFPDIINTQMHVSNFKIWKKLLSASEAMDLGLILESANSNTFSFWADGINGKTCEEIWSAVKASKYYKAHSSYVAYMYKWWTLTDVNLVFEVKNQSE
jgi:hypothetical protein